MPSRKPKPPPACATCHAPITFARIHAASIPLDPAPSDTGTVAVYTTHTGARIGRWLAKNEQPIGIEKRYAQHRCPKPAKPEPSPQPDLFTTTD